MNANTTATAFDLTTAVAEVADQFRAIKARNVRWCLTSIPLADLRTRYGLDRDDAFVVRELAFEEVTPRLVEIVGEQLAGRGQDVTQRVGRSGYHARKAIVHGAWLQNPHVSVAEVMDLVGVSASCARVYLTELRTQHL